MTFSLFHRSVIGYSCVKTMVVVHEYSVLLTRFNTCPSYFKVESKITRDFKAQCSLFTYSVFVVVEYEGGDCIIDTWSNR